MNNMIKFSYFVEKNTTIIEKKRCFSLIKRAMNKLEQFGNIPIDNAALYNIMGDYRYQRNKVGAMERHGDLIRLKNGLYVVSPEISRKSL
jgi:predicted transcriptional regulator of viral defense system